jgi:hypothetical protein
MLFLKDNSLNDGLATSRFLDVAMLRVRLKSGAD